MLDTVKVFPGVLVLRRVAAADVAAGETQSEVHPAVTLRQTLLAALWRVRLHIAYLIEVGTGERCGHGYL